jgi:ABC-type lipoprotein release transport system permease subunit
MKKKRHVQNRHSYKYSSFIRTSLITLLIMAGIFGIILMLLYQQGKQRSAVQKSTQQKSGAMQVLGDSEQPEGRLIVNVPTEFTNTIFAPGQTGPC